MRKKQEITITTKSVPIEQWSDYWCKNLIMILLGLKTEAQFWQMVYQKIGEENDIQQHTGL